MNFDIKVYYNFWLSAKVDTASIEINGQSLSLTRNQELDEFTVSVANISLRFSRVSDPMIPKDLSIAMLVKSHPKLENYSVRAHCGKIFVKPLVEDAYQHMLITEVTNDNLYYFDVRRREIRPLWE